MTLQEWSKLSGVSPANYTADGAMQNVPMDIHAPNWSDLWHLSDFAVTSVVAGSVWLKRYRGSCASCQKQATLHKVKFADDRGIGSMLVCAECDDSN